MTTGSVWLATGTSGWHDELRNHPRRLSARKRELNVTVRFAEQDCVVATREGAVQARAGDAIVTGSAGEQWPVRRDRLGEKYRPLVPDEGNASGNYVSLPVEVLAVKMDRPFALILGDGVSRLAGLTGDYLVDYGDGSLGIVGADIFAATYDIIDSA